MSGLTKDQLKNELVNHGVELPSSSAKKAEYLELYEKHVSPVERSKGDFSSDEEDITNITTENQIITTTTTTTTTTTNMESSHMVVDGIDISSLDDDELFTRLKSFGAEVGPIVDTTRKVYQRKLLVLMGGEVDETPTYNGDVDEEEEYSDNEEPEPEPEPAPEPMQLRSSVSPLAAEPKSPSQTSDIRRRVLSPISAEVSKGDSLIFDPDRHTPSPRRSLRTVHSTVTTTETTRKFVNNGRSGMLIDGEVKESFDEPDADTVVEGSGTSLLSLVLRLIVKLLLLILIIAVFVYLYQNNSSESPFKAVETLARQALEAAVGEEVADGKSAAEPVETTESAQPPVPEEVPAQ